MTKRKKIPSIAEQAAAGAEDFKAWSRGDLRLRTTIVAPDGSRTVAHLTRAELDLKQERAQAFKDIRAELKMSQSEFARLLHAGPAAVKQWEQSRRAIPEPVLALAELARDPEIRVRLETLDFSSPHPSQGVKMKTTKANAGRILPRKGNGSKGARVTAAIGTRKRAAHA